jgi:kynureninase
MTGAEGWQLSNPPIFQLAALKASLELFDRAGMAALRAKGDALTGYMEHLLTVDLHEDGRVAPDFLSIITPADKNQRGSQLSIRFKGDGKKLLQAFKQEGVICDFREPDIIRATPAPMYCSFQDVHRFYEVVKKFAQAEK